MKIAAVALLVFQVENTIGFAPAAFTKTPITQRPAIVDPSILADVHHHIDTTASFFSSLNIADASDLMDAAPAAVTDVVATNTAAAADAVATTGSGNGWFGFLEGPIEYLLQAIHGALVSVGMSADAWGITIIAMTTFIKLGTYPLTASQLESTNKMQTLQPTIKGIQAKYQSNPEVMNQKIAEVYQTNQVNPLAGCIPSILQIPIFIGLYRAVLTLAKDDKLNEPFLWLPNLEGPTYGADPAHGSDWILKGWESGVPSLGWDQTAAFLVIPVVLILSQSLSMNLMASKEQEQPAFLKFLPLLIGWFSLNVPAALGIYWIANNIITTALTLQIRSTFTNAAPVAPGASTTAAVDVNPSAFTPAPLREKPSGFGASDWSEDAGDGVSPITPIEAEVVTSDGSVEEANVPRTPNKKRGKKKKKRRKN